MSLPKYLKDLFKKVKDLKKSPEYKSSLEEAKKLFSENIVEIEKYLTFFKENTNLLNSEIQVQLQSIKYLKNQIPDLNIQQSINKINISSSNESFNIPIKNVDNIVAIKKIVDEITISDALNFFDFITEYPMLGYKHEVGKKIFNFIENYKKSEIKGNIICRIRGYSKQRKMPYSILELIGPPFGISPQNRFNYPGMNVTYFSENLDVLKEEIGINDDDRYSMIKVQLIKKFLMLDIRDMNIPLFQLCQKKVERKNDYFNIEYILPNYIADCARSSGFDGILYKSTINEKAINYVFFYLKKNEIKKIERVDNI